MAVRSVACKTDTPARPAAHPLAPLIQAKFIEEGVAVVAHIDSEAGGTSLNGGRGDFLKAFSGKVERVEVEFGGILVDDGDLELTAKDQDGERALLGAEGHIVGAEGHSRIEGVGGVDERHALCVLQRSVAVD